LPLMRSGADPRSPFPTADRGWRGTLRPRDIDRAAGRPTNRHQDRDRSARASDWPSGYGSHDVRFSVTIPPELLTPVLEDGATAMDRIFGDSKEVADSEAEAELAGEDEARGDEGTEGDSAG
jgi:hypothetical protein